MNRYVWLSLLVMTMGTAARADTYYVACSLLFFLIIRQIGCIMNPCVADTGKMQQRRLFYGSGSISAAFICGYELPAA
ncbi:MAG: hypothetical protein ISS79_08615 [Phycisphaerae bacterium]|nr:hypothetical protein [Phycisphaerae bacterium]